MRKVMGNMPGGLFVVSSNHLQLAPVAAGIVIFLFMTAPDSLAGVQCDRCKEFLSGCSAEKYGEFIEACDKTCATEAAQGLDRTQVEGQAKPSKVADLEDTKSLDKKLVKKEIVGFFEAKPTRTAIGDTRTEIARAREYSAFSSRLGTYEQQAGTTITNDRYRVSSIASPLLASPDPQDQSRGQEFLSRRTTPPAEFAGLYKNLGLLTNRDVLEKAPNYADNLGKAAPEQEKLANFWDNQAKQGEKAASQMENFAKKLEQRNINIASLDKENLLSQKSKESAESAIDPSKGGNVNQRITFLDKSKITAPIDPMSVAGEKSEKINGDKLSSGTASPADSVGVGGGRNPASAKTGLREALLKGAGLKGKKAVKTEGEENAETPKSAFDSIFEKIEDEKLAAAAKEAKSTRDHLARADSAFSMNGSETDAAVKNFLNGAEGRSSSEYNAAFGSVDQSIFARMTSYLTRAQLEKRITVRQ